MEGGGRERGGGHVLPRQRTDVKEGEKRSLEVSWSGGGGGKVCSDHT